MEIKTLKIFSPKITAQKAFYTKVLGLEIIAETNHEVSFKIGHSVLKLAYKASTKPYHFAINIPFNQIENALAWLKQRVDILKDGNIEIQNFEDWNAKAVYFYDKDNNIVEFIARENLNQASHNTFDAHALIEISEIGVPTNNIEPLFNYLNRTVGLDKYDGGIERFCAIGDEQGLFICINKTVKNWFPTNEPAFAADFEMEFIKNGHNYHIEYKDEKLRIHDYE